MYNIIYFLRIVLFIIAVISCVVEYLPLFINLQNRSVLVIGGGTVATRKIIILQRAGANIKIVSRTLCAELIKMLSSPTISWVSKVFDPIMLDTVFFVIVATNDIHLNNLVYQNAEKRHVFINTVDDKNKCSCIFPSIVDRTPILIGISSSGTAPVLARILREKIELLLPKYIGMLAKFAGIWRNTIKERIKDIVCRRRFWEKVFYHGHVAALIEQNFVKEANKFIQRALDTGHYNAKRGSVALVGAGPGDRELLTIRGLQIMQKADVILYDYLVNDDILELARRDIDKICVGKRAGKHLMSQEKINALMIKFARHGNRVVRLKGGDPFIFGRGGEELQAISAVGIPVQVVPGITAGIGIAAYAGIPLTHRKYAHSVVFITGHCVNNNNELNWKIFSDHQQTLVIYMGKINAINISKNLILHGRNMYTPVAVIERGTYKDQRVFIGNLMELGNLVDTIRNPALLIIGDVVSLCKNVSGEVTRTELKFNY